MPFVITPTFNIKRIDVIPGVRWGVTRDWLEDTVTGKLYNIRELYETADEVVTAGFARLQKQKQLHKKAANNIEKRERNLNKFAQSLKQGA